MECKDQSALLQLKTMMNFEIFEIICDRSSKFNGQTLILQQITKDKSKHLLFSKLLGSSQYYFRLQKEFDTLQKQNKRHVSMLPIFL